MRMFAVALLFVSCSLRLAFAQSEELATVPGDEISLNGEISIGSGFPLQQQGGYYKPVQPQRYQRKCGTISTDVCEVPVSVPAGATGEQLYQLYKQALTEGRKGEALGYLHESAEAGYALGEGAYGFALLTGQGAMRDTQNGLTWLEKSAAQGNRGAEIMLGMTYEDGSNGVARDQARAIPYIKAAAAQHHSEGEYRLGLDYELGRGVPRDRAQAIHWLQLAAADGAPAASATAKTLANSRTPQFSSVDELNAYVFPAPEPAKAPAGSCGPVPTLSVVVNRFGFSQMSEYCGKHHGCPYIPAPAGREQTCY